MVEVNNHSPFSSNFSSSRLTRSRNSPTSACNDKMISGNSSTRSDRIRSYPAPGSITPANRPGSGGGVSFFPSKNISPSPVKSQWMFNLAKLLIKPSIMLVVIGDSPLTICEI